MEVFFQELKRQLNFTRLIIYILISITLAGLWTWFIVGGASEDFMQTGCYNGYKGRAAIKVAAKDRIGTTGKMTEDKFQVGCDTFINSLKGTNEGDLVVTKKLLKYAVYADKLVTQEYSLRIMRGESTKDLFNLPKDAGKSFYKNEDLIYRNYIDKNAHNENERKLALSMWNKVEKPYIYYSGFKQWDEGIEHIMLFSFVLMIIVGVFGSSMIAKDNESGIDEIIKATTKGRKSLTIAKIVIPWIMASIVYLCGVGIYIMLLKWMLPYDALNTSIQVLGKSFSPWNTGELLKKVFIFGGAGLLTIASFSTCISSITKKYSRAIQFSILTILAAFILGIFINMESHIIDVIRIFMPGGILFLYSQYIGLDKFPIATVFGKSLWMPSVLLIVNEIIFLLSTIFTALNYRRR